MTTEPFIPLPDRAAAAVRRSAAEADASMKTFEAAPAAGKFMSMIVPNSMVMTRYGE
jgi:hypothetical protein